jgi:dTDP-4-amino-4,6-dideoxy-D-galactose acyltransferase
MGLVEQLQWDSAFFGLPIGRVSDDVAPSEVASAVREADDLQLCCVYLCVAAHDHALIESAQEQGFLLRDIRVELARAVDGHPSSMTGIRAGRLDDMSWLTPIAQERFPDSRFFVDKGFPRSRSREFYVEWIRRGLTTEPRRQTLVTQDRLGFVVCGLEFPSRIGSIELIGVAEGAGGDGLGTSLIAAAGAFFIESSMITAQVVTQGSNIAAQRLYQASGYRTTATSLWLHRWQGASHCSRQG